MVFLRSIESNSENNLKLIRKQTEVFLKSKGNILGTKSMAFIKVIYSYPEIKRKCLWNQKEIFRN